MKNKILFFAGKGKAFRDSLNDFIENNSLCSKITSLSCEDFWIEAINYIEREKDPIRCLFRKYSKYKLLIVKNCEGFGKRRSTLALFAEFLRCLLGQDIGIVLTFENV